ncbi:branched-chain amino acid ABC transporter permease [Oceanibacterium hippocampi]|uniref:Leucine/isoleucine/valine transporter permease subunit n=1 Tax=Oceanibacterium hippocampi TaxID=745714 RepID=A0A1Y5U128_9PROT|nr:branched-chain amino acid ABC transporter permease [Oceanibacterium hippocampi]SLN73659.1 leucine/isoleucine/valine transporter permease subunit [Oceanibacterium hippocampi]
MSVIATTGAATTRRATFRRLAVWLVSAAVLLILPQIFTSGLAVTVMNQMGIAIVFALSYNMMLGQGGMLSFGHAVYFGLGGFFAMHMIDWVDQQLFVFPIYLTPFMGGLFGLFMALVIGSFSTRRAGTVFAMISLGIGELVAALSLILVVFFGGEEGVSGDRTTGPGIFGFNFLQDIEVYYLIAVWVLVAVLFMYLFSRTPAGRMANAVRDNPERAEFVGYSQRTVRLISFCAAGFFAGIAGGLFAINYEILTEQNLNATTSGGVLLMAYIGGIGYFIGPIVGAVIFTLLQTVLSGYTDLWVLYVGLVFLATVLYVPTGLTGIMMMHVPAWRLGRLRSLVVPYLTMVIPVAMLFCGLVGLLEMFHYRNGAPTGEVEMTVFYVTVDFTSPLPWAVFTALTLAGGYLTRRLAPAVAASFQAATSYDAKGSSA